ncbi:CoA transferase [Synechococcus sp. CBW1004]|nr:CoA transferase [Synechococcus sp. CBW1004]
MTRLPLDSIRVIDLGHEWSCPHAARFLADYGAEVIKIEYTKRLDFLRGGITRNRAYDGKLPFWQVHRNKKSLTLDLRDVLERDIFERLVCESDIVLENSRPGVMDRLGLGYQRLRELKPDIIMVSMSAFGSTGPESQHRGYGGTIEAMAGIQSLTAYQPDSPPRRIREMDVTNGIMGAAAALTALIARQHHGVGEWIDLSEAESASHALLGEHMLACTTNGSNSQPIGNRHPEFAPQGCYPCLEDDSWLVLTVQNDSEWASLCVLLERPDLAADERLSTASGRHQHHDEIDAEISSWSRSRQSLEACEQLQAAGIAAGPVMSMQDLTTDQHLLERSYFLTPEQGDRHSRYPGFPFRMTRSSGRLTSRGPALGAHNHEIVCDLLGLPEQRVPQIDESKLGTSLDPLGDLSQG